MQTGLEGKPWYFGLIVGIVLGAVAFAVIWFQFINPKIEETDRQQARLESLQREISKGRAAQQSLPRFREEVRVLQDELDKLLRILPARRNVQELLRRVRLLVERGDFDLKRIRPGAQQDRDFYSEWPIQISLDGSYHNLALFFDRISRFSRIINIDNLNITAINRRRSSHTISASFTAKTFIYKEGEVGDLEDGDGDHGD
jgi:Tfp pilus assembly protein PilO